MVWAESLARSRREIGKAYRSFLKQFRGSRPIAEALEARVMMSVVPVADAATDLVAMGWAQHVASAVAADGSMLVAWSDYDSTTETYDVSYNIYDSSGVLQLTTPDDSVTGTASSTYTLVSGLDVAVNASGQAVITWAADDQIYFETITLTDPLAGGWEQTIPAYTSQVTQVKAAINDGGDVAVAWTQASYRDVQPTEDADPIGHWFNTVYVDRYDFSSDTWLAQPVKVSTSTVVMDHGTAADDFDVAINSGGGFVVGWDVTNFDTRTIREASGAYSYSLRGLSVDTFFQRYSADGDVIGSKVKVAHHAADDSYAGARVTLAADTGGAFTFITDIRNGYSDTRWMSDEMFSAHSDTIYRRSFDRNGAATTGEIQVAKTDATAEIPAMSAAYDGSHQLLLAWVVSGSGTPEMHLQTISPSGQHLRSDQTLDDYSLQFVEFRQLQLLVSSKGIGLGYYDAMEELPSHLLSGTYLVQEYTEHASDLSVTIGQTALLNDLKTGDTASGALPIVIKNIGNETFDGTVTLHVVLSTNDTYGDSDDIALQGTDLTVTLKLKKGASKTLTLADLHITPEMYMPTYNNVQNYTWYSIMANATAVTADGAAAEVRADNNVATGSLLIKPVVGPDPTLPALAITSMNVAFSHDVLVPGDTGSVVIKIRNTGDTDLVEQQVGLYVVVRPTYWGQYETNGDVTLEMQEVTLSLKAGATKTFRLRLNLTTDVLPDNYYIAADVSVPVPYDYYPGWVYKTVTSSVTDQTWKVLWEFGNVEGRAGNTVLRFKDSDGGSITYSMSGRGFATLDSNGYLRYFDTTGNTKLAVTTKNWTGSSVSSVQGYSTIGTLDLSSQSPTDGIYLGAVKELDLFDMTGIINIRTDSTDKVNLTMRQVQDLQLTSTMAIGTFALSGWLGDSDEAAGITAPTIDKLVTRPNYILGDAGDFVTRLTLTGTDRDGDGVGDYGVTALKSAFIRGDLWGGVWNIQGGIGALDVRGVIREMGIWTSGSIGSVTASSMWEAGIMAGVNTYDDYFYPDHLSDYVPLTPEQFKHTDPEAGGPVTIGQVTMTNQWSGGDGSEMSSSFYIAAARVGKMSLGYVDTASGLSSFGVVVLDPAEVSRQTFGSVSFRYWADVDRVERVRWTSGTKDPLLENNMSITYVNHGNV